MNTTRRTSGTTDLNEKLSDQVKATKRKPSRTTPPAEGKLTVAEHARLAELEAVVETNLEGFVKVGDALIEIRDAGLYRESHGTFEQYLADRWKISRSRGYRLMAAARVVAATSPSGDTPMNEAQARELVPLLDEPEPGEAMREVMDEATAEGRRATAGKLRQVSLRRVGAEHQAQAGPKPTVKRRGATQVRDLPDHKALLADPLFATFEKILGDQPLITLHHRTRRVADCIEVDFQTAIDQQEAKNARLRELLDRGEGNVTNYRAAAKLLRPAFKAAQKAKAAARKPVAPTPTKTRLRRSLKVVAPFDADPPGEGL